MVISYRKLIVGVQAGGQVVGTQPTLHGTGLPCLIIATVSQSIGFFIHTVFIYCIQVLLAEFIDGAQTSISIDIPALQRMEHQLSLQIDIVVVRHRAATIGQLRQFTVTHVVSVGILERHGRPHTYYIMIKQATQIGVQGVVQIGMHVLHIYFYVQPFERLSIQFCVCTKTFIRIVTETQVTVLS